MAIVDMGFFVREVRKVRIVHGRSDEALLDKWAGMTSN